MRVAYCFSLYSHARTRAHPQTPNVHQECSKRSMDGQVRKWRRMLHAFDPGVMNGSAPQRAATTDDIDMHDDSESEPEMVEKSEQSSVTDGGFVVVAQ